MKDVVIFDWQGTLVNVSGIRHLVVDTAKKNFAEFHLQTGNCPPIESTVRGVWDAVRDDKIVIVMSGCPDNFRETLAFWMMRHDVVANAVLMRRAGDWRKDVVIKAEMLAWVREQGFKVTHAWDDNPNILRLWADENIPTTVVPGWVG